MSYKGKTFSIPCNKGGLTGNPNIDIIAPEMMVNPTSNINLHENGRGSRGGTSHVNSSAISGTPQVMGLHDFTMENGNQFLVMLTGADKKIWKDFTNSIHTFTTANQYGNFTTFNNDLYICNGSDLPQVWSGTGNTTNLTNVPADWSGTNYPSQLVKHGRYNSERLWGIGAKPHWVYASKLNDGSSEADFSDAEVTTIHIETGDGAGIVGGIEFGDRLICFGKRKSYIIDDLDVNADNWGYNESQWDGGVSHDRLIMRVPNDLICMMDDGTIYSVVAAQQYGDYKQASLTRPAYIDKWIRDNIDLTKIDQFHGEYDPKLRAIKIFVVRKGQTTVDTSLVYFLDRGPIEGWSVHSNQVSDSGYSASASCIYRDTIGDYKLYTGDYSGFVWRLETTSKNDNDAGYYAGFKTAALNFNDVRTNKLFQNVWIVTESAGEWDLQLKVWIDGLYLSTQAISLEGSGVALGTFLLDTDFLVGDLLVADKMKKIKNKGKRVQFEIFNNRVNEPFFISSLLIDYKLLGRQPE